MKLTEEEINNRDNFHEHFSELLKEKNKGEELPRWVFDHYFQQHGATFAMQCLDHSAKMLRDKIIENEKLARPDKPTKSRAGLYNLFMKRLKEIERMPGKTIPMREVYQKLCASFCITKTECRDVLLIMRDFEFLEYSKDGVKILMTDNIHLLGKQ